MSNPIVHVEVVGEDGEALQSFYRDTFDWQMLPSGPGYAMARPGVEVGINGGIGASPEGG
jgi:predicted enzyme related to lactoylglutathione lyase